MTKQLCGSLHNGQAKTQTLVAIPFRIMKLHEFLKNRDVLAYRNSQTGIEYLYLDLIASAAAAKNDPPAFGIANGVRDQIGQYLPKHHRIAVGMMGAFQHPPFQAFAFSKACELVLEVVEQIVD